MTRLVIYPDNTFALLPDRPAPRQVKPLQVAGYLLACTLISGVGLVSLPFVITALGAAAPFAPIGFLLHRLWKVNRCSR